MVTKAPGPPMDIGRTGLPGPPAPGPAGEECLTETASAPIPDPSGRTLLLLLSAKPEAGMTCPLSSQALAPRLLAPAPGPVVPFTGPCMLPCHREAGPGKEQGQESKALDQQSQLSLGKPPLPSGSPPGDWTPSHGGKFCEGPTRTVKLCNSQPCPQDSVDFRAAQCAAYNSQRFRGWHYKWKPYTQVADQDLCKLYCIAEGFDFFFSLSNKVKDGTPCSEDSRNVCVDGICERVGCDNILGSDAAEDSCGVCKGNNSDCTTHRGVYTTHHHTNQYYHVVTLPPGARSIRIYEMNTSTSYICVRNALKRYYLNGHWTVDWPGRYEFAGTTFRYRRSYKEPESLTAAGPTNETLMVELLFQGRNPGISWEYSVPRLGAEKKPIAQPSYTWAIVRSECSVSCGGGQMATKEGCYRDLKFQVNTSFCNPKTRPITGLVSCKVSACPPRYTVQGVIGGPKSAPQEVLTTSFQRIATERRVDKSSLNKSYLCAGLWLGVGMETISEFEELGISPVMTRDSLGRSRPPRTAAYSAAGDHLISPRDLPQSWFLDHHVPPGQLHVIPGWPALHVGLRTARVQQEHQFWTWRVGPMQALQESEEQEPQGS
ncbi:Hypothetical predicted protein [Marmota monax]|uniref:Uncharacterized protein n=1 Tax=Marmota monax TaxID=9995 RepID=A0A5E4B3U9_MARMO|nr:Hypothetical predicted protein [Marmota monax]